MLKLCQSVIFLTIWRKDVFLLQIPENAPRLLDEGAFVFYSARRSSRFGRIIPYDPTEAHITASHQKKYLKMTVGN